METPKAPLQDIKALAKFLFNAELYPYQEEIIKAVFAGKRKITVRATTRAGKSYATAMLAILYATFCDNKRVGIIAPSYEKTRPIMDWIISFLSANPLFEEIVMVDTEGLTRLERLRKEVSKKRITFRNGSSIEIKTVDMAKKGFAIMGMAYNLQIIDESGELTKEVFAKIYRMLLESPESCLLEIGNPWFLNHFYEHHHSDEWDKHVISWQDCVDAGRMTKDAVEEQRRELSELEFRVLMDAEFPEEIEYAVFQNESIENMNAPKVPQFCERYLIGVDVARGGRDKTVITVMKKEGKEFYYSEIKIMDTRDTMRIVGEVCLLLDRLGSKNCEVSVDTVGVGAGVYDRLKENEDLCVYDFVAGSQARDPLRFANLKSEVIWQIAEMAKHKRIYNVPRVSRLVLELRSWIYEAKSDKQIKVIDPEKSPDEADSFCIALHRYVYPEETTRAIGVYSTNVPRYRQGMIHARDKMRRRRYA